MHRSSNRYALPGFSVLHFGDLSAATPQQQYCRKCGPGQRSRHLCRSTIRTGHYVSMGFGNPYGDPWSAEVAKRVVDKLVAMDIVSSLWQMPSVCRSGKYRLYVRTSHTEISRCGVRCICIPPDAWLERSMRPGNTDAGGLTKPSKGFWRLPNGQDDLTNEQYGHREYHQ